jgi:5'-methylthioadenosine phosphorylase
MTEVKIGVIGGSGLYRMRGLTNTREVHVETPFGTPSDVITVGEVNGVPIAFLPRHGRGHRLNPTEVPVRANIWALKSLGVESLISVSAVGSLREDYAPRDLVVPDQIFDRTKSRVNSFFEGGIVVHCAFADPFCPRLSEMLLQTAQNLGEVRVHRGGTYVCMEGPLFSTRAESNFYRQNGMSLIGMTALPEAKLAREAELCYTMLACVTDYDCWHEEEEAVTVEMVVANLSANSTNAQHILSDLAEKVAVSERTCSCGKALDNTIMTDMSAMTKDVTEKYRLLLQRFLA